RHAFASALAEAGVPHEVRALLLGHAAGSVTEAHYTEHGLAQLAAHVAKVPLTWPVAQQAPAAPSGDPEPAKPEPAPMPAAAARVPAAAAAATPDTVPVTLPITLPVAESGYQNCSSFAEPPSRLELETCGLRSHYVYDRNWPVLYGYAGESG